MPWCIHHPDVQVITDFRGVSTCYRCEAEKRAEFDRRCRICMAPVAVPGLCPTCGTTVAVRERAAWLGHHAGLLILLIVLLGLWASWSPVYSFACDVGFMHEGRHPCYTADPPPDCHWFARSCSARARAERDAEASVTGTEPQHP